LDPFLYLFDDYIWYLRTVNTHYPLVDLSRLERGYPKEVGPREADDLHVNLLDLSSTMIGDINICRTSTPPDQPGSDRSARELSGASIAGDGRLTPVVSLARRRWPRPLRWDKRTVRVINPSSRSVE